MSETPRSDRERDEQLSSIYRAVPAEAPPPALDDAIRAAARREVGARPRRAGAPFARWQMPLSIAAVLVLCVSLVVLMRDEGGELTQVPRAEAPAARDREPAPSASVVPKIELVPETSRSKNIGFKASTQTADAPAAGADAYALAKPGVSSGFRQPVPDAREAKRGAEPDTSLAPGQRVLPSAFPEKKERGVADQLEQSAAANVGKLQARRDAAPAARVRAGGGCGGITQSRSRRKRRHAGGGRRRIGRRARTGAASGAGCSGPRAGAGRAAGNGKTSAGSATGHADSAGRSRAVDDATEIGQRNGGADRADDAAAAGKVA